VQTIRQDCAELLDKLSILETDWKDELSQKVVDIIMDIDEESILDNENIKKLFEKDFEAANIIIQLFLEMSKDEYRDVMRNIASDRLPFTNSGFKKNKDDYVSLFKKIQLKERIESTINRQYTWRDILIQRLKSGRGSAIKGQKRGRELEDFVENSIRKVFNGYDVRCNFQAKDGIAQEKADFAIPSKDDPQVIIEVKGYGATGSKQTDVIGDINRIINEKRHDSYLLLFTDGITWRSRGSDFSKLVKRQNEGYIFKIYTKQMVEEFETDLERIKFEKSIET